MFGALDISTSGLVAQKTRLTVITANQANSATLLNADGEYDPYRRKFAVFAPGDGRGGPGVHVEEIETDMSEFNKRYQPGHPFADESGYVSYPNVNSVVESMNAMEAARSYEANIAAAEATKSMMTVTLKLLG